jgi:methyl-accepting chemotaxis protein
MQHIRAITNRNTDATQRAADTVGELAELATDLKASVSGFKLS